MQEIKQVVLEIATRIPQPSEGILLNRLRAIWLANLYWVMFYRVGVKAELEGLTPSQQSRCLKQAKPWGLMYAQLLTLTIGISEAPGQAGVTGWRDPRQLWKAAILEQVERDFLEMKYPDEKAALKKIKDRNAKLLRELKNFEIDRPDGTALGKILHKATLIACPSPGDDISTRQLRNSFRRLYWNPYIEACAELNRAIRKNATLLVERGEAVRARLEAGKEIELWRSGKVPRMKRGGRPKKI